MYRLILFTFFFTLVAYAQKGYSGYTNTDYVPLPGCAVTGACAAPAIPAAGPGCATLTTGWTAAGCTTGVGYVISGDNSAYGSHAIIRVTDATLNSSKSFNNASQGQIPHINSDTTLLAFGDTFGNTYLQGFNPVSKVLQPFSTALKFSSQIAFSRVTPSILYVAAHIDPSTFAETTAPEISKLIIGHLVASTCTAGVGGGTPCVLSASKLVNFVSDTTKGLDSRYNSLAWTSSFGIDNTDTSFTLGYSLGGQGSGVVAVNYTVGSGIRVYHTDTRIVTGDWGSTSCATGTASCFDGTATQTSAYVALDWIASKTWSNAAKIAPYDNNSAHCVFTATAGVSGVTASEPNWDSLDGGSCSFATPITDNTTTWTAAGVNPGVCGAGCTPVTEPDTYSTHEVVQKFDSAVATTSADARSTVCLNNSSTLCSCLKNKGNCQQANVGEYIWYPVSSLNVQSCYESSLAATPDYQNNTAYGLTGASGAVIIYPRTNNAKPWYFTVVQAGTSLATGAPDWSLHQGGGAFYDDGCVSGCAGHLKWIPSGTAGECSGHTAGGYLREYVSSNFYAHPWHNYGTYVSQTSLSIPSISGGIDIHGTYNNADVNDTNPYFASFDNVDVPATGAWLNSGTNYAFWNELAGMFPSSTVYGATFLRMGHNFNSGTSSNFQIQNGIGNVSPDGNWMMFASDLEGTLGSEGGAASCTLGGASGTTACRGDVFLMQLRPLNALAPATLMFAKETNWLSQ